MNAKKLKDSILEYAVQGKLNTSSTMDLDIKFFLEEVRHQKKEMINNKIIKKDKDTLPLPEELPYDLPIGWSWVRLGEVFEVTSSKRVKQSSWQNSGIPFYRAREIVSLKKNEPLKDPIFISEQLYEENIKISGYPKIGDILLTGVGTLGVPFRVENNEKFYFKDGNVVWVKNHFNLNAQYIELLFDTPLIKNQISSGAQGTTVGTLTIVKTKNLLLPLPPFEEQERILIKVNELFEKIKLYNVLQFNASELKKKFPSMLEKSIIQYAMQGKLIDQDPNEGSSSTLLEEVNLNKSILLKDKKVQTKIISEEEIMWDIPDSWEWVRLGEVCEINPRNIAEDDLDAGFIPMKLIEEGTVNKHTFEKRKWGEIKKGYTHFKENDIVVAKITPCFENRKSVIIQGLPNGIGAGTTELYVFRPYSDFVDREYLLWIFKSQNFIEGGKNSFSGTAGQQRVSKSYIENFLIPLPPYKEQKRIVKKILEFTSVLAKLTK